MPTHRLSTTLLAARCRKSTPRGNEKWRGFKKKRWELKTGVLNELVNSEVTARSGLPEALRPSSGLDEYNQYAHYECFLPEPPAGLALSFEYDKAEPQTHGLGN